MPKSKNTERCGLESIRIYFWEGMGESYNASTSKFRLEVVRNGLVDYFVGGPSYLRNKMAHLGSFYKVKFPKVSWKKIEGDDDGGSVYKWSKLGLTNER